MKKKKPETPLQPKNDPLDFEGAANYPVERDPLDFEGAADYPVERDPLDFEGG